uniref:HDC15717 n=1 Tax=Drosophila melanogaster TaxID=7227 RepID=Q6IJ81_DROME|nr:TPA_inf: HDC15717 [Drosophila melanogaster]
MYFKNIKMLPTRMFNHLQPESTSESPTFVGLLGCRLLLMMMTTKVGCAPVTHPLDMFRARFVLVLSVVIMPQTYVSPSLKSHMSLDTDVATHACHGLGISYSFGHITLIIAGINDLKITGS